MPEVHHVEICLEDFFFGMALFQGGRHGHVAQFSDRRSLGRQEEVFRQLLGQRTAPLGKAPRANVCHRSTDDPFEIQATMVEEPLILNRQHGIYHMLWNISQRNRDAFVTRRAVHISDEFRLEADVW